MSDEKPLIGVTGPDRGGTVAWLFTRYSVWRQGGRAVRITPSNPGKAQDLDALILGGGADIDPRRYGQDFTIEGSGTPSPAGIRGWMRHIFSILFYPLLYVVRKLFSVSSYGIDRGRDELEFALIDQALESRIPVLGICRGAQLINVKLGGDLHRDVEYFYSEIPRVHSIWPRKKVKIEQNSFLYRILERGEIWVNALHHQAIYRPGEQLRVVAREESGIIQAVEHIEYPCMLGVQWHPEYMPQVQSQAQIFKGLVEEARKRNAGS